MKGIRNHPLYDLWRAMVDRCHNPRAHGFKNYGGRGIVVCSRWRESFDDFVSDVGERPSRKHSLDRKDNDGNYEPGNVRWATRSEQARNTRFNRLLTAFGKTQTAEEWAIETGLPKSTLFNRIRRGWPDEKVIGTPRQAKAPDHTLFPVGGYRRCVELGINHQTVASRLRRGWTFDRAITAPVDHRRGWKSGLHEIAS